MQTISLKAAERMLTNLRTLLRPYYRLTKEAKEELESYGFEEAELGTGIHAYITSKAVCIMDLKSSKYLTGKFLVIGEANRGTGKGKIYRGYVMKIEG